MPYELLREKMSIWPAVVPEGEELTQILRYLFTPEEAEVLSSDAFSAPFQDYHSVAEIASITGKPFSLIKDIMESLERKKRVFTFTDTITEERYYSLFPVEPAVVGFFIETTDEEIQKVIAPLFEKVFHSKVSMGEGTDMEMWGRIIPVEQAVTIINEILTFESVSTFIEEASCISVANCFCKSKQPCHHPIEVCMAFDEGAEFVVQKGIARFIEKNEAYELLKKTEDAGLVHISTNTKRGPKFVCNCCTCSCFLLKKLIESETPYLFSTSQVLPSIDLNRCERCYRCADICPFEAIEQEEDPQVRENRCVGCGLCAHHCPHHAIFMVPAHREEVSADTFS
jgi:Pyruvate/2-oxoacid:ferredoxin oxidoreductase delta subunit